MQHGVSKNTVSVRKPNLFKKKLIQAMRAACVSSHPYSNFELPLHFGVRRRMYLLLLVVALGFLSLGWFVLWSRMITDSPLFLAFFMGVPTLILAMILPILLRWKPVLILDKEGLWSWFDRVRVPWVDIIEAEVSTPSEVTREGGTVTYNYTGRCLVLTVKGYRRTYLQSNFWRRFTGWNMAVVGLANPTKDVFTLTLSPLYIKADMLRLAPLIGALSNIIPKGVNEPI